MDFSINEMQTEIARQARRFFENECPVKWVREMFEDERGFTDDVWTKMAEMGWMGIRIPEAYGGMSMELVGAYLFADDATALDDNGNDDDPWEVGTRLQISF